MTRAERARLGRAIDDLMADEEELRFERGMRELCALAGRRIAPLPTSRPVSLFKLAASPPRRFDPYRR